jgi:hypothetical protein
LKVVVSARTAYAVGAADTLFYFNNDTSTSYSWTRLYGTGSGAGATRNGNTIQTQYSWGQHIPGSSSTANTFGSFEIYIPNYSASNFKQSTIESVTENNATAVEMALIAGLYRNTAAINSITFTLLGQTILQYSTFTLYGIKNA